MTLKSNPKDVQNVSRHDLLPCTLALSFLPRAALAEYDYFMIDTDRIFIELAIGMNLS
jgi:hypothetical protein